jgi:hypothetical protein
MESLLGLDFQQNKRKLEKGKKVKTSHICTPARKILFLFFHPPPTTKDKHLSPLEHTLPIQFHLPQHRPPRALNFYRIKALIILS